MYLVLWAPQEGTKKLVLRSLQLRGLVEELPSGPWEQYHDRSVKELKIRRLRIPSWLVVVPQGESQRIKYTQWTLYLCGRIKTPVMLLWIPAPNGFLFLAPVSLHPCSAWNLVPRLWLRPLSSGFMLDIYYKRLLLQATQCPHHCTTHKIW